MRYISHPNLLMEALSYLGRGAGENTWEYMEERIRQRGIHPSPIFTESLNRLKQLTARLNRLNLFEDAETIAYFRNMEGFPKNTIGSASPAFLIFYGLLEKFDGDFEHLEEYTLSLQPEQISYHMALALDLADDYPSGLIPSHTFMDMVLSLSIPDNSKVSILNVYRRFHSIFRQVIVPVKEAVLCLQKEQTLCEELCQVLNEKIQSEGCEKYLSRTSRLVPAEGTEYILRPFLFGMDTSLTSQLSTEENCVYCGILREYLLDMLSGQVSPQDTVYEIFRLLGDRTRFDLVCYLNHHTAYGQELSAKFGLSRNTIHHHMSKLSATGLVHCTANGNRVYYSLDEQMILMLLEQQKELFFGKKSPDESQ